MKLGKSALKLCLVLCSWSCWLQVATEGYQRHVKAGKFRDGSVYRLRPHLPDARAKGASGVLGMAG